MPLIQSPPRAYQLKAVSDSQGLIEGYASLYGVQDFDADVVAKGAFDASLAAWRKTGRQPPLLWQHDTTQPIGVWTLLKSDARGLYVKGQLFIHDIAKAAEAYALLKNGALSGLSIGFRPERVKRDAKTGVRTIEQLKLFEISLVTVPALDAARISSVKTLPSPSPASLLPALHALQEAMLV